MTMPDVGHELPAVLLAVEVVLQACHGRDCHTKPFKGCNCCDSPRSAHPCPKPFLAALHPVSIILEGI
jgi:hypothetical protein